MNGKEKKGYICKNDLCASCAYLVLLIKKAEKMLETKKYKEWIEPIENRIKNVQSFFSIINKRLVCSVKPIYDVYGATIIDKDIEAIVVSEETRKGGEMVNEERVRRNMKPLDLFCINVIPDIEERSGLKLSSVSIREKMTKNKS
ncbi:unnamed protein product [Pneumocystis jirovecii]|uniref:Uncharacterized protein n=1 Tax=Pneumocystis jirovecii TaxID=42068 RepID=L0PEE8_PNEJI|nr:unnamed protein product [Pneumocystis jirovecii]